VTYPAGPPSPPSPGGPPHGPAAVCVRHPDRATRLSCTRCDRPACPECLREASVGYQCVDCVGQGARDVRRRTTVAGALPARGRPVVVWTLIAINVLIYAWTAVQAGSITRNSASSLFREWALAPVLVADGDWWRLVTSGFLHIGPLHIASNMFALWVLGRDMEAVLGRGRFLALYMISLLGGSAAVMVFSAPNQAVAGASGAVFGLMGGLVVVLLKIKRAVGQVIALIAVNIVISQLVPGISLTGHLGGLAVGTAAAAVLVFAPRQHRTAIQTGSLAGLTALLLVVIGVTASAI
jgi:membrane associated rhomboid family serine protease